MAHATSEEQGVQFPLIEGRRSTQAAGKRVFAGAVRYVDASLADHIDTAENWHKTYISAIRASVELGMKSSKNALRIASDGLEEVQTTFTFQRDGSSRPLGEIFASAGNSRFSTEVVDGTGEQARELAIPYGGRELRGTDLRHRVDAWRSEGRIEPSTADAVEAVIDNPEWLDLRDVRIALLGAASEMGPLEWLARWGAEVIAVDLPVPRLWEKILSLARRGAGRVYVPVTEGSPAGDPSTGAGADLLVDIPELAAWLSSLSADSSLVLGNYAYAPGAAFVRVAAAADVIAGELASQGGLRAYSYLASPTEIYSVPREVVDASAGGGAASSALRAISRGRLFARNYSGLIESEGRERGLFDCLVPQQGPNYALAKTLHRWRALAMREMGVVTSANVAPATRTMSVVKNRVLAAAYAGAKPFGVEVFEPETSRALMAALLVADLRDPVSPADPETSLDHSYDLFSERAAHGGLWRMHHAPRSALPMAVVLGFPRTALRGSRTPDS